MEIRITDYCNLNCKYCYAKPFSGREMSFADFKEVVHQAKEMGVFLFYIAGGEPLLHPHFLDMLDYIIRSDVSVHVLTNATRITPKLASDIKTILEHAISPVSIQVSLDSVNDRSNDAVRGLTQATKLGIAHLLAQGIQPTLASVLTVNNIDSAEDIVAYFYPQIRTFNFMPLLFTSEAIKNRKALLGTHSYSQYLELLKNAKERLKRIEEKYKDVEMTILEDRDMFPGQPEVFNAGCSAGVLQLTVMANLDVITCAFAPNLTVGNIRTSSLREIWKSIRLRAIRGGVYPCLISNEEMGLGKRSAWDFPE